jgi:hypothetical protein
MTSSTYEQADEEAVERMRRRLGRLDPVQVRIWRAMRPARRIELACQAYHLVLEAVRVRERELHPELSAEELNWRVVRRLHGDERLGTS